MFLTSRSTLCAACDSSLPGGFLRSTNRRPSAPVSWYVGFDCPNPNCLTSSGARTSGACVPRYFSSAVTSMGCRTRPAMVLGQKWQWWWCCVLRWTSAGAGAWVMEMRSSYCCCCCCCSYSYECCYSWSVEKGDGMRMMGMVAVDVGRSGVVPVSASPGGAGLGRGTVLICPSTRPAFWDPRQSFPRFCGGGGSLGLSRR